MTIFIPSTEGKIEAIVTESKTNKIVIICHPHPLYGGTMTNKVVTTLDKSFQSLGLSTLRFNFRGVGDSSGQFAEGVGETDDVITIANWIQKNFNYTELWLAGFSFGAYVSVRAAKQINAKQLVTVAPPIRGFNFNDWPKVSCPWLVIQGEQDEVIKPQEVYRWIDTLNPKPTLIKIPDATHFFHGKLNELKKAVIDNLI